MSGPLAIDLYCGLGGWTEASRMRSCGVQPFVSAEHWPTHEECLSVLEAEDRTRYPRNIVGPACAQMPVPVREGAA